MRKIILSFILLSFLAAGCAKVELRHEVPYSPRESYEELPK